MNGPEQTRSGTLLFAAKHLSKRALWVMSMGLMAMIIALSLPLGLPLSAGFALFGGILIVLGGGTLMGARWGNYREIRRVANLTALVDEDAAFCFVCDDNGHILYHNKAVTQRFGAQLPVDLDEAIKDYFAAPNAVIFRLQTRANKKGHAREDLVIRRGHLRLAVHLIAPQRYLWRLDEFNDQDSTPTRAENHSLPLVISNRAGVVLFSNDAMRKHLGKRPKRLNEIFDNPNFISGHEVVVESAQGRVRALVAEVDGVGDRREIFLLPVSKHVMSEPLQSSFEDVPVALMRFSALGKVLAANKLAREMLNDCPLEDVTIRQLFEDIGRPIEDWLNDIVEARLPSGVEVLRLRLPDEDRFAQVQLRRVSDAAGVGAVAVLSDATALKKMEEKFTQSQKMQAIGQLAGGISHDFNNLLTAISGHCDLLLLRHGAEDIDHADLEQIRQNSNRAAALVSQLLAFSRKQTLKLQRLDLRETLSETSHLLNRLVGEKIQIEVRADTEAKPVRADRRQLEQVVMNLVVNARDAMPQGGAIILETEGLNFLTPQDRGQFTVPAGEYCALRVIDAGSGIPPDRLNKIFEPFFTTKRVGEGTGLGLSTVYGIIKQSGGYVFVDSTLGVGTCFEILLPAYDPVKHSDPEPIVKNKSQDLAAPAPVAPAGVALPVTVPPRCEGTVLLVEDEAPVRAFASRALRMRGLTVLEAESAEDALELLADPSVKVDVFVTDVIMPGLDGPSWVKIALEQRPDVKVIFISGYAEDYISNQHVQLKSAVFLPKPFSLSDLTKTVQAQLV